MEDDPRRRSSSDTRHALTGGFGEARPWRLLEPRHEFVQGHVVDAFRNRGRDAVEYEGLQLLPLGDLLNRY